MGGMSSVRTYVVGRARTCDVRLDDASVSRRHAEVVRVSGGRLFVTDCATTNGTFVLDDRAWCPIRQAHVAPADTVRFGDVEMRVDWLDALCRRNDARAGGGAGGEAIAAGEAHREDDTPDPSHGLARVPETGELIEKERPRGRRR